MSKQTNSSGYSSDNKSDLTIISTSTKEKWDQEDSPSEVKPFTISTKNDLKQQDDELDYGNVYHRIHVHDDDDIKDFEKRKGNNRRPLPLPPRDPPDQPEKERFYRRPCTRFCFGFGIVIVVLLCAAAVSIKITCFKDLLCENEKENKSSSLTPHPCDAQIQQDYSFGGSSVCKLALQNPKTLMLRSENADTATFALGDSGNNVTLNGIVFTLKRNSTEIHVDIEIQQVNCSNIGTYYVTVSNGTVNETYLVNVQVNPETQRCPCTREEDVGKRKRYITCKNVNKVNVTVVFRGKTSVDDAVVLAKDVSMDDIVANGGRLPIKSDENIILIAEAVSNTTTFKLEFSLVKCSHVGTYAITFGNTTFETAFTVKSTAQKPVIEVDHERRGGLVEGRKGGQVRCDASVGCGEKPTMWEYTYDGFQNATSHSTKTSSSSGITYYEDINMNIGSEQAFNNTEFKCNFTHNGEAYESDIFTALVVPKNWCDVNNFVYGCHVKHPFYCDKWITCETGPVEQACIPGTHFYFEKQGDCQGTCDYPEKANCTLGRK